MNILVYLLLINKFLFLLDYSMTSNEVSEDMINLIHKDFYYKDQGLSFKGKETMIQLIKKYNQHNSSSFFNQYSLIYVCEDRDIYILSRVGHSLLPNLDRYNLPRPGTIPTIHGDYVVMKVKDNRIYSMEVFDVFEMTVQNVTLPIDQAYYNLSGAMFMSSLKYTEISKYQVPYKTYNINFKTCTVY